MKEPNKRQPVSERRPPLLQSAPPPSDRGDGSRVTLERVAQTNRIITRAWLSEPPPLR